MSEPGVRARRAEHEESGRLAVSDVEAMAEWVLDRAGSVSKIDLLGADLVYFFSKSHNISLCDGTPEENVCGVVDGIGVRTVARDGRQGVAYGNSFSRDRLAEIVEWSCANCASSEPEDNIVLYGGHIDTGDQALEQYDGRIAEGVDAEESLRICNSMNDTAKSRDERVVSVRAASWSAGSGESFYASTEGVSGWRRATSASCGVSVVLSDGDSYEMGSYGKGERFLEDLDPNGYAVLAVDRTRRLLGASPLPTGKYTLVLDPEVSASIAEEIGELFCASDVHKGRSLMKGRLGSVVAGIAVTLVDDARLPRRTASSMFDGEGVPTGRTVLVDSGVASAYLYNLQYAEKDGTNSTGNAVRGLSSLPDVGTSNLFMVPGKESPESLISRVKRGFLVQELMGLHTLNPVSGDFSLGAKGLLIANGRVDRPVSGVTIAGNLLDFLGKVSALGSDLEFFGSVGAPTLVVEDVTVAGS